MMWHLRPAPATGDTREACLRSWYAASILDFLQTPRDAIVGVLARNGEFSLLPTQKDAWLKEISLLQSQLAGLPGWVFLEFNIPRMGRRIDAVLVVGPVVFVVEFKVGESIFDRAAVDQVWDYALDLKNFHQASHAAAIVPILVATEAMASPPIELYPHPDRVYRPISVDPRSFRATLNLALRAVAGEAIDPYRWSQARLSVARKLRGSARIGR